jgi:1-acyl-sn-glycerol-3-phosphate acyltransferase
VLLSQRATWRVAHAWAALTLFWLRLSCGVRTQVRGREHKPVGGGLVACKHQSAWDTLVLWRTLKNPAFVLKKQLYLIPIFGWYLWRSGQIAIDRSAGREAMRSMLEQAQLLATQRRTIVIFPEGTRVPPGEEVPFHAGVARLSQALGLSVTPAALNGGLFWPKHSLKKFPGTAVLEFLPPQPAFSEPVAPWLAQLQRVVNTHSAQLENEAT